MISVIIPAHNEEAVIERGLRALLEGAEPGEVEVIVACNGCTDRTAEKARAFGHGVRVVEIPQASKTAALNAADCVASCFPRIYVDADVVLPLSAARKVARVLERDEALLASPVVQTDTRESSAVVRAFYDVWLNLPYNRVMVGTGVYGLSERGRARFGEFPPVIADDGFVRSRFEPEDRAAVEDAVVTVAAVRTLGDLIRVKTRVRVGLYQLQRYSSGAQVTDRKDAREIVGSLPVSLLLPWKLFVYVAVSSVVRLRARRRMNGDRSLGWDRDHASRTV